MSSPASEESQEFSRRLSLLEASKTGEKGLLSRYWNPVLEKYRPKAVIGQGQFGQVIRAKHKASNEIVAIKQVKVIDCQEHLQKVIREIALLRHFSSIPGFVGTSRLVEAFSATIQNQMVVFIVMEYIPLSLADVLDNAASLGLKEAHVDEIFEDISKALQVIHAAGVMHRDLKPANILVKSDLTVKICDFGFSRQIELSEADELQFSSNDSRSQRRLSMHVQTRYYRAPEVILLERSYDKAIDLWSLGCILAEMLGCLPEYRQHESGNLARIVFAGRSCHPLSPAPIDPESKSRIPQSDQLRCILRVLGRVSEDDRAHIGTNRAYLDRLLNNSLAPISFSQEFPATSRKLVTNLENLLQFNPSRRTLDASANPDTCEPFLAMHRFSLDLDHSGEFDYTSGSFRNWSISDLKARLLQILD